MVATAAPLVAQAIMLAVLLTMRRWLFAMMLVPSIIGCLAMMLASAARRRGGHAGDDDVARDEAARREAIDDGTRLDLIDAMPLEGLLSLRPVDDDLPWRTIARRWLEPASLDVPVGMHADGVFRLDLRRQGPHALVAGTTGSGKSVLLQSWCLALACRNTPDALRFVFLDFKGGTAFRALERLPHCVGNVCDLDLRHATRALNAIEAELRRRERLMADAHAQDVTDLGAMAPPRLVIVADEFHALKDQLPDMVDRLVRIASLGRALGMHVIACTQHPAGQVSSDMKANMSLGICLRVRDGVQSSELLGSTKAAYIPPSLPGVAYCNDGATVTSWRCAAARDIPRLVDAIAAAARFHGCIPPPALFTAPLPRRMAALPATPVSGGVPFALRDDGVTLHVAHLPLDRGNIGVIGRHGRGKTNLLDVIRRHVARATGDDTPTLRLTAREGDGYVTTTLHGDGYDDGSPAGADAFRTTGMSPAPPPGSPRLVWLVDDADPLFDPFGDDPLCTELREALADHRVTVVFATETSRHVRVPEHCAIRVVFPTGDRATDQMNGIPGEMWTSFDHDDMVLPGRAVLIDHASAAAVQCVSASG
ncbi:DNA segregation ATPase and related proteins (FtsK/SpoIIIE family) [Bifidobacterium stellenboschense]|uniref:DNA segregation ATPase and related proteins (FtsK/SpoIIIE family) n=2 Tax=Bifidobacterium stellenboschense TaxID=762211 RepID=A0A087DZP2_9BIFI|nr:FtsK/SpoIIIE domain-containing protein [Bifidobacterium stellenboschense]KFJ00993.1 DNA segregation ATPase and related proteins (FtsK/SpoIIIE family) [Bifidobacterium stellenboschense]